MMNPLAWLRSRSGRSRGAHSDGTHRIIVNEQAEEYLVWPTGDALPMGWRDTGESGPEAELHTHLQEMLEDTSPAPLIVEKDRTGPRG